MAENNKYRAICSTCKNAAGCTFPKNPAKPVLRCEEFEVDTCPPVETSRVERSPATASVDIEAEDSVKFLGLCSNCDNLRTCTFPKPAGGVWHCEEYK